MKKLILLLLTAALLLAACTKEAVPVPEPEPEPEPVVSQPAADPEPAAPADEPEPAPEKEPETEPQPAPQPAHTPESEEEMGVTVDITEKSGSVEESVSYEIRIPALEGAGSGAAAINAYYEGVANKLHDMAYGEIYEQALDRHAVLELVGDCTVERNDGKLLSVRRSVAVYEMQPGTGEWNVGVQYSEFTETFDVETGGLLTPGDIFDAEQAVYTERLVDNVRRYIREHPGSDSPGSVYWRPEWETLAAERFDPNRFYLTSDAYVVLYAEGELGEGMGTDEFHIPWRQLADILKIEV